MKKLSVGTLKPSPRKMVTALLLSLAILLLSTTLPVNPAASELTGIVCIASSEVVNCPPSPSTLMEDVGNEVLVAVNVQGSDSFNCFDVTVQADPFVLRPLANNLTGSLLLQATSVSILADTVGYDTARMSVCAEGFQTSSPTTGRLFAVRYKVLDTSLDTSIVFLTGCTNTSVQPDTCVTVSSPNGTLPETAQTATFRTADFIVATSPSSLSLPRGGSVHSTITITSIRFSGTVFLSTTIQPMDRRSPTASLDPSTVTLSSDQAVTVSLTVIASRSALRGNYILTVTGQNGGAIRTATITLSVT